MARLTKDGSRGLSMSDLAKKPPLKTLIIPAKDLVQIKAKGVPVTKEGLSNELQSVKQQELLIDSFISQSSRVDQERELERWVPEDDDPGRPELENIFDGHWDRGWDQFRVNETLFGVKSTFDEELYTTKLEKGPQTKELEKEASRIAREIEGEDTRDIHQAEERGIKLLEKFEIDEESRYSSVLRGVDDSGYDDIEDILVDTRNDETFGGGYAGTLQFFPGSGKVNDGAQGSTRSSHMDEGFASSSVTSREVHQSGSDDARQLPVGLLAKDSESAGDIRSYDNQFADHTGTSYSKDDTEVERAQTSKADDSRPSLLPKKESSDRGGLSATATAYAPSLVSSKSQENASSNDQPEGIGSSKVTGTSQAVGSHARTSSSASSTSDSGGGGAAAARGPGLSPTSSMGSLTSEKSTLNPHAKEFKLNPNAKSFIPSQSPLRPASPVADTSFYYSAAAVPPMPVGLGIGPSFAAHQPVIYNPQAAPPPQPYFHPGGPQYGRQMMIGHPQQVLYMPATYTPEMPYKGREY
ncbi:OLC1v1015104C1 [Oldenlandia corymbosa var. corymbosa]|nr:OLC1v1015104C1 [Oldenlandia corymbosa var. corymbosa]